MSTLEVKNAVIEQTHLGYKWGDHGILTFSIALDYGGSGQGFGSYALDEYNQEHKTDPTAPKRIPSTNAASLLIGVNALFGCDWEELKGRPCRAYGDMMGIRALGASIKDRWLWCDRDTGDFVVTTFAGIKA